MMFDRRNQRHQFILDLKRYPEGKSFDIIEDVNNPNAFNFYVLHTRLQILTLIVDV
jgi:hypothetical protein